MLSRLKAKSFGSIRARTPPASRPLRIGLLGGSFNPPHLTHAGISEAALKRLDLDQVWWLVSPGNPLKHHGELAPLAERIAACRRIATNPKIKVTAFEADLGTNATVIALSFLKRRFPGVHFVWLMGGDNLAGFHRWIGWRTIASFMPLAVVDRPDWRLRALASPAARVLQRHRIDERDARRLALSSPPAWVYLSVPLSGESSTYHRSRARSGSRTAGQP